MRERERILSGSIKLEIVTGQDWFTQVYWSTDDGPVSYTDCVMEIRRDLNSTSPLLARLDSTDTADGLITASSPGTILLHLPAAKTKLLQPSTAFFDLFLTVANQRARLLFGTVAIKPHVTATV